MPAADVMAIATICKYASDYLKIRRDLKKDRKGSERVEKDEAIRDYIESSRRRDHAQTLGRIDLIEREVSGLNDNLTSVARTLAHIEEKGSERAEKNEAVREYIESCRRQDHAQTLGRFDLIGTQLSAFEQLLTAFGDMTSDQGAVVTNAIEEGNLALLSTLGVSDLSVHAKLDQIIHRLGVEPRRLFLSHYESLQDTIRVAFEDRYLARVRDDFGRLEMIGVPDARDIRQQFDVAYVNLELTTLTSDEGSNGRAQEVFPRYRRLTIRGPAGSGKTTLLRWIAFQCAVNYATTNSPWKGGVPLFVPLRKLAGNDLGRPNERKLYEYGFEAGMFEDAPSGWLWSVFEGGRAVLLLDGVDEIPHGARKNFWAWLNALLIQHPATRAFVTSRPLSAGVMDGSLEWSPPVSFNHAELKDLSPGDRTVFIRNWHNAVKAVRPDSEGQLDVSCSQLLRKLHDRAYAHVRDLCKNPLTAGLICALYWQKLKLPDTRGDLYEKSCDMLIEVRDEARDIRVDEPFVAVKKTDRLLLLQCLAWEMMQNVRADNGQNIEANEEDAVKWLGIHLPRCAATELQDASPTDVLDYLVRRSGLIRVPAAGFVDFHHRSFQEYLAACAAATLNQLGNLLGKAGNDQWRDTIVLAANTRDGGVPFGRQLIEELLHTGQKKLFGGQRRECVALAAACLAEMRSPPPELRANVEARLGEIVPPRSKIEADALVVGGEAVLPYLSFEQLSAKDRKVKRVLLACVHTIARIGTEQARQLLVNPNGYHQSGLFDVWESACACPGVDLFDAPFVLEFLAQGGRLPASLAPHVKRLNALAKLPYIQHLDLQGSAGVTDIELEALTVLQSLKVLNLCNTGVTDDGLKALSTLTNLVHLDLGNTAVTDAGLKELVVLKNLIHLDLECTAVTDAGLKELVVLTELTRLFLTGTQVTSAGQAELRHALPRLELCI